MQNNLLISDPAVFEQGRLLPVMEAFYTIQGEGGNTGKPAYFIRVGGCDVGCHWCDVKESWDASLHPLTSTDKLLQDALQTGARAVVITGGEPSLYPLDYLTQIFQQSGLQTFVETSGAYPLSGSWDWVCLSPKKTSPPLALNLPLAHECKVIVHNRHDFLWAEEQAKACREANADVALFMQPEWSKMNQLVPEIIDYVKTHQHWRISLQTHKFMHIP